MGKNERKMELMERFRSIQNAIFVSASVLILLAVGVSVAISLGYTQNSLFENTITYNRQLIRQVSYDIDSYIDYMENISAMFADSEDIQQFLFAENDDPELRANIRQQFETIMKSRDDIYNLGVVCGNNRYYINQGTDKLNPYFDVQEQEWYQHALENEGTAVLSNAHVEYALRDYRWVITLSRSIENQTISGGQNGVFFVDLNYSAISDLCQNNSIGEKGLVFVLDDKGDVVYHPQQQRLYYGLKTDNFQEIMNCPDEYLILKEGENRLLYTMHRSEKTGWTVVSAVDVNEITTSSQDAQKLYLIIAFVLVGITMILSNRIAKSITRPVQHLRNSMKEVQQGHFENASVEITGKNEISELTENFNVMTHKIQELMQQNVYEQEQKRKSELKALQSQINPHFLYNTLDSIIWMAEGKKNEEVVIMTASLARLLRQSISNEDELVPLATELGHVKSYLTIQKMRYKDKLEFSVEYEPSVATVPIIKLVLQPLVENAIYHGLKYKENRGMLRVHAYEQGNCVVVEISDNGVGMSPQTLEHIFEKHKVNYGSNGVGVYNVQNRLKLYYGEDYGISYSSIEGEGTIVTVKIPRFREWEEER